MKLWIDTLKEDLKLLNYDYEVVEIQATGLTINKDITENIIFILPTKEYEKLDIENTNKPLKYGNALIISTNHVWDNQNNIWLLECIATPEEMKNFQHMKTQQVLENLVLNRVRSIQENHQYAINNLRERKVSLVRQLHLACQELREKEALKTDEDFANKLREQLTKELKDIVEHKKVKSMDIIGNTLHIYTHHVYAIEYHTQKRYSIGEMDIQIGLNDSRLHVFNQTTTRNGYEVGMHHPHIFHDGHCCLGTAESSIIQYLTESLYYHAFVMILDYLENGIDTDDAAGHYVFAWDEVDENGNIIKEGNCYEDDDTFTCNACGDVYDWDDHYECEDCHTYICPDCVVRIDDTYLCPDCANEQTIECDNCYNREWNDHSYYIDGQNLCERCYNDLTAVCPHCGEVHLKSNMSHYDGDYYCNNHVPYDEDAE